MADEKNVVTKDAGVSTKVRVRMTHGEYHYDGVKAENGMRQSEKIATKGDELELPQKEADRLFALKVAERVH